MNRRFDRVGERDREVIDPLRAESHVTTVLAFTEFDEAQRRQRASVERATAIEVCDTDREVIDDDATDWHAVNLPATRCKGSVPHHVGIWSHRRTPRQLTGGKAPAPSPTGYWPRTPPMVSAEAKRNARTVAAGRSLSDEHLRSRGLATGGLRSV